MREDFKQKLEIVYEQGAPEATKKETERGKSQEGQNLETSFSVPQKSRWGALKYKVMKLAMAASMALEIQNATLDYERVEAAQRQAQATQIEAVQERKPTYRELARQSNDLYKTDFEKTEKGLLNSIDIHKQIIYSPEFQKLHYLDQAEFLHREAYSEKEYLKKYYINNEQDLETPGTHMQTVLVGYNEVLKNLTRAVQIELDHGGLSEPRQRSLGALVETSKDMAYEGILIKNRNPELAPYANILEDMSSNGIESAMQADGRTRNIGHGMHIFSKKNKETALLPIIGLARFIGDIPKDMPTDKAVHAIGGANYDVKREVVPWANAVLKRKITATGSEQALIDSLVKEKILEIKNDQIVATNEAENITFTPPDKKIFTHEIAHQVFNDNKEEMMAKAKRDFAKLPKEYQDLFIKFMSEGEGEDPSKMNMSDDRVFNEFFAYSNQAGLDWREHARKILKEKNQKRH